MFGGDINELRKKGERVLDPLDVFIAIPLLEKARIIIGKQKEPFIYELVGDSPNLPQQERLLNAFFEQRNIGVSIRIITLTIGSRLA